MFDRGVELRFDLQHVAGETSVCLETLRLRIELGQTEWRVLLGGRGVVRALAGGSGNGRALESCLGLTRL